MELSRLLTRLLLVMGTAAAMTMTTGSAARADTRTSVIPYIRVDCESWTRLKIRCKATVIAGYLPFTYRWSIDDTHYPIYDNLTSVNFACSPSNPKTYWAAVTDGLGNVEERSDTARCLTTTP
ncbi:hypothetical protein [Nonomuraea sp. LPB2021202275-12-8]|uniref:hypothetical protein n=1 Tax=Nonomuraea sp. LPB2021202275-12-8 TaxID=3120159 RepID=UPI00300D1CB6